MLDLTTAWSGPMCTRILAALGADVLKVEGPGRIDDWRGPIGRGHPGGAAGERPFDRCYQFNTQNHDKRSLVVDFKDPSGLDVVLKLADRADVMIANFGAGTLARMGLGWDVVHARNERLIVVEMPAYGGDGPIKDHVALGPSMELMSGMARSIGYGDGRPVTTGPAYLDPLGGFNSAAAVLTALSARQRTGRGQYVEIAQREAAMHWIGEHIILAHAGGADREPAANRNEAMAPHDAFPAKGEDSWVAVAAENDAGFAGLVRAMGQPDLAADPRFATFAARKENEDALTAIIASWTRGRDKHETAALLQAAGVLAAPVQDARDLFMSAHLRARGLTQSVSHPAAGTNDYLGLPLHISGWDLRIRRPGQGVISRGFRTTSVFGAVAAAVAASKATKLTAAQTAAAASIGANFAGGLIEGWSHGTHEPYFQAGMAAEQGVRAARLARAHALGALPTFEGRNGFLRAFADSKDDPGVRPGGPWRILDVICKPYPCSGGKIGAIDSARALRDTGLDAA